MFQALSPLAQSHWLLSGASRYAPSQLRMPPMTQWSATRGRFGGFSGTPRANTSPDRVIPPLKLNIDRIDQGGCLAFPIPLDKSSDNRRESIAEVPAFASLGPRNLRADTKSSAGLDLVAYTTRVGLTSTVWTCLRIGCRFGAVPLNLE